MNQGLLDDDPLWFKDAIIYELNNRPDWVPIPIEGLRQLLGATE